jgi:hypothetical protein
MNSIFFKNFTKNLRRTFSPGWCYQPGLKDPPAAAHGLEQRGGPLVPVRKQSGLKKRGFNPALLVQLDNRD